MDTAKKQLPLVVVFATGGTIAAKVDPETGGVVPALSGVDLIEAVPGVDRIARISVINFSNIDSSQMEPEIWGKLSRQLDKELADPEVVGAVVTHGTDTIAEAAFFLDVTLYSNKPVVLVGAMRDAGSLSADGPGNIYNAVLQACSPESKDWGVTVTLNQYINSAFDVVKSQTTNVQAFNSGEKGYLGYIQDGNIIKFRERGPRFTLPVPEQIPRVPYITTFAGDDGDLLRFAVESGARGVVVGGVGAGNVNSKVSDAIQYAIDKGVKVVITSQVFHGGVWPIYGDEGGGQCLQKAGCIFGGSLRGPKARLLLMLALSNENECSDICEYFSQW